MKPGTSGAYGSLYFLVTGGHVAHLVAGLLILGWVLVRSVTGAYSAGRHVGVQVANLYWQFVVVLAVIVYLTTTVSPHL